jgi:hypothetical protein
MTSVYPREEKPDAPPTYGNIFIRLTYFLNTKNIFFY